MYKDRKKTVAKRQGDQIENIVNSSYRGNRNCFMHPRHTRGKCPRVLFDREGCVKYLLILVNRLAYEAILINFQRGKKATKFQIVQILNINCPVSEKRGFEVLKCGCCEVLLLYIQALVSMLSIYTLLVHECNM